METRVKYPRTFHLPWSLGATNDDKVLTAIDHFIGKEITVTEKMDGENTTLYSDGMHARSLDSSSHDSQSFVKQLQGEIGHLIPKNFRVCGENLFAKHSIHYTNLSSYFLVFSVWENDRCLSWQETCEWAALLGLTTVPVLFQGTWDMAKIQACYNANNATQEGYVVRVSDSFLYENFKNSIAKFVRQNPVQTDKHWKSQQIIKNVCR